MYQWSCSCLKLGKLLTLFLLIIGATVTIPVTARAESQLECTGGNIFESKLDVIPAHNQAAYRIPIVGFVSIIQAPNSKHRGRESYDFKVAVGTAVVAARAGRVYRGAFAADGYGNHIIIKHYVGDTEANGLDHEESVYAHLSDFAITGGEWVTAGQLIGFTGDTGYSTGPHLHFEVVNTQAGRKFVFIRQIEGVHWFAVEQQNQDVHCQISLGAGQFDGYAFGPSAPGITPYDGNVPECKVTYDGVILYNGDGCVSNQIWNTNYNNTVFAGFKEKGFEPYSVYIAPGWSVFIDDGTDKSGQEHNHLCATRSLWDLNLDYYHPVPDRLIAENVNRMIAFHDTTCGGRSIDEHGQLNSISQYPPYTDPTNGIGGGPAPDPDDSSTPPNPDPNSVVGVRFFTEKHYQGSSTKLGYGTHDFATNFWSVQMDRTDMHFFVYDSGGTRDCFDFARFNNSTQYSSFNDHGDWWDKTVRVVIESGVCPGSPNPNRKVTFYSEKNYQGSFWQKQVGFDAGMTDNFYSVKIDEGIAFFLTNTFGQQRCFDKFSFNGNNEYPTFNDHGDWWDNTIAVKVQTQQCTPEPPRIDNPGANAAIPYGSVVIDYHPWLGSESIRGELHGLSEVWQFSQPESVRSWNLGALPAGSYTVKLWAVSSHGTSGIATRNFTVSQPDCNQMSFDQIAVFVDTSCHDSYIALEPGWWSFAGSFYKNISSIFIPLGWSAEVIQNGNTSDGPARCLDWSMWDLATDNYHQSDQKIGDNIESIIVFPEPNCGRQSPDVFCHELSLTEVVLFDYTYCKGSDRILPTGTHVLYGFNDLASSMFVPPGKSVKVWKDYFTGPHACWTGSKWILNLDAYTGLAETANNSISVVEVFDDERCGIPPTPELYPVTGSYGEYDVIAPNTSVEFWWSDVGADSYKFELLDSTGELVLSAEHDGYTFLENASNLAEGTYVWKVKAVVLGYESAWAERTLTVKTQAQEDSCFDKVPQSGATVFEHRYCGGSSLSLAEGSHDLSDTNWNNSISSITLADGYSALIYESKPNQNDGVRCITSWTWDFAADTYSNTGGIINDTVTYIEIMHSPDCNGWNPGSDPAPLAPTNLRVYAVVAHAATVAWDDSSTNEDGFIVLRWADSSFVEIARVAAGTTYYINNGLQCNMQYRYKISAYNTAGQSESNELTLTTTACPGGQSNYIYLPLIVR